ncbi:MAG: helix-turn-helix domain-containing protein [Desulfobacterales bacterium]|jgi:transcriptional regulator with XRE-family HTH domain|nr:helix-turn-helix domain-containing protein [Desulfobacterales bacterium]
MDEKQIAKNIKKIRLDNKLSQERLAELSGLTKGYISKIEKSDKAPPFSTLNKIANALNVDVAVLTAEDLELPEDINLCIVRKSEGKKISSVNLEGYHYEVLAHKKKGKNMEPFFIMPAFDEEAVFCHEGEEFMYVLEGTHEFVYDKKKYILKEGDSIYFDSIIPHTGRSIGKKRAKILAVLYSYKRNQMEDSLDSRITVKK